MEQSRRGELGGHDGAGWKQTSGKQQVSRLSWKRRLAECEEAEAGEAVSQPVVAVKAGRREEPCDDDACRRREAET